MKDTENNKGNDKIIKNNRIKNRSFICIIVCFLYVFFICFFVSYININ